MENVERDFQVTISGMRRIMRDFSSDMEKRLEGRKSSLKMIPTYVDKPTGDEKGVFLALDLGGTNFRVLKVKLQGHGRVSGVIVRKFALNKSHITGDGDALFSFLALCIKKFLRLKKSEKKHYLKLGFTFSFPVKQTAAARGLLIRWTKDFKTRGVEGKDVVGLLKEALARYGINNITISALANDTVGTLVCRAYEDKDCDVGIIIGTGTNACYREKIANIPKWKGRTGPYSHMIINIEWGNFDKLASNKYDRKLDRSSENPGEQILEKMVSGMYMGELARLVILDLALKDRLFRESRLDAIRGRGSFKTEFMSAIEADRSRGLVKTASLFKSIGIKDDRLDDRRLVKLICENISRRAARISASALGSVITKMDPRLERNHTVAIDGSVFEKHPTFSRNMRKALREIFKTRSRRLKIVQTKDGSGKGAAIIAAVASTG